MTVTTSCDREQVDRSLAKYLIFVYIFKSRSTTYLCGRVATILLASLMRLRK